MRSCGVAVVLASLMAIVLAGCGGAEAPVAPKVDVAGTVNYNGEPMNVPDAEIAFAVPGQAPVILPITAGKFEGKGPVGQQIRVEIRAFKKGEPIMMDGKPFGEPVKVNIIPSEFNDMSTLTANIPAGGVKDLKFDVADRK